MAAEIYSKPATKLAGALGLVIRSEKMQGNVSVSTDGGNIRSSGGSRG